MKPGDLVTVWMERLTPTVDDAAAEIRILPTPGLLVGRLRAAGHDPTFPVVGTLDLWEILVEGNLIVRNELAFGLLSDEDNT